MDIVIGNIKYDKPILAFYMGYSVPFNGKNYDEKNTFGSENTVIHIAEVLKENYKIFVFSNCNPDEEIVHNDISYLSINRLHYFKEIDILIIVRYINYFIYFSNIAKKTYIMVCDTIFNPSYNNGLLPDNGKHLLNNIKHNVEAVICVSEWQKNNINSVYNIQEFDFKVIPNTITTKFYKPNVPIIKKRFIYMSDPSRGLDILLDCLLYIQNIDPDISLVVFRKNEFTDSINNKLDKLNNKIVLGKESQETIANYCLEAEYFFYPPNGFCETFCNCAAEAQLYNTVCIYNPIGALVTTIGDRGMAINYDHKDMAYVIQASKQVIDLMNDEDRKRDYIKRGRNWAKKLKPTLVKNKWLKVLK